MRRRPVAPVALIALAAGLALACARERDGAPELRVSASVASTNVELGRSFPLRVVLAWSRALEIVPFDEQTLAPLVTRLKNSSRREIGDVVEETRDYDAWAFGRDVVTIAAPTLVARARDGAETSARGEELRLTVRSALASSDAGEVELPLEPLALPAPRWRRWLASAAAALVAVAMVISVVRRRRLRRATTAAAAPAPDPSVRALERLRRLDPVATSSSDESLHVEAAAIVRDYLFERFDIPASFRTSEELTVAGAVVRGVDEKGRRELIDWLARCDRVKFALHRPHADERVVLIHDAQRFVVATGASP